MTHLKELYEKWENIYKNTERLDIQFSLLFSKFYFLDILRMQEKLTCSYKIEEINSKEFEVIINNGNNEIRSVHDNFFIALTNLAKELQKIYLQKD